GLRILRLAEVATVRARTHRHQPSTAARGCEYCDWALEKGNHGGAAVDQQPRRASNAATHQRGWMAGIPDSTSQQPRRASNAATNIRYFTFSQQPRLSTAAPGFECCDRAVADVTEDAATVINSRAGRRTRGLADGATGRDP